MRPRTELVYIGHSDGTGMKDVGAFGILPLMALLLLLACAAARVVGTVVIPPKRQVEMVEGWLSVPKRAGVACIAVLLQFHTVVNKGFDVRAYSTPCVWMLGVAGRKGTRVLSVRSGDWGIGFGVLMVGNFNLCGVQRSGARNFR